jgi:hypothetical protein
MRVRTWRMGIAVVVALAGVGAGSLSSARAAQTAPSTCRVFNPLFNWDAGQTRTLRASARRCDAAPGRRASLMFQANGDLAFYLDGRQLWDSGTNGRRNRMIERGYGGLDIVDASGEVLWGTHGPQSEGFEPHPNGGFGIGFTSDGRAATTAFTHWTEDEGLCGTSGGCGQTLWTSGKGVS